MGDNGIPHEKRASQKRRAAKGASAPSIVDLKARTLKIGARSVSIRLEPSYWDGLEDICSRERLTAGELITGIKARLDEQQQNDPSSRGVALANAVRVFIVGYYRRAATENGHSRAGHGRGDPFVSTPFDTPNAPEKPEDGAE